jgi:predicted transcriptional regulator
LPVDAVRSVFESTVWSFPSLERAAERITAALGDNQGKMAALYSLLRADHGLAVQVLPVETMPVWKKRLDRHSGRLFISERLPREERAEVLAQELVLRRESEALDEEIELLKIEGDEAKRLARMELARYTALCVLMPYNKFLQTAERLKYDPLLLATRFETGFSQVAERLVSLQDKSSGRRAGLPFFAMQIDQGGNLLRRIGAKGFPVARFGGNCPTVYLTLSKTIDGPHEGAGDRPRRTAVLLGIEDVQAKQRLAAAKEGTAKRVSPSERFDSENVAHTRYLPDPVQVAPLAIGPSCRLCERTDCVARSAPPITRPLGLDDLVQGFGAYGLT